ncbi:MAG: STAS domain-containing protein [Vicingus serpentipes]|nr:STAS domain-containing protein [Vicingus serpentipes]
MSFSYQINTEDELLIVTLSGNLINKQQAEDLMNELDFYLNEGNNKVVINLDDMMYMNSTGLNVLINIFTRVRNRDGEVVLTNIPEKINKLLLVTKLNSIFNVEKTLEDAKKILI